MQQPLSSRSFSTDNSAATDEYGDYVRQLLLVWASRLAIADNKVREIIITYGILLIGKQMLQIPSHR